jgi:hypothetical protein
MKKPFNHREYSRKAEKDKKAKRNREDGKKFRNPFNSQIMFQKS